MKYLSFQPGFDVYHTEFRILRILSFVGRQKIYVDQIRILDFYLLYFFRMTAVKLARGHRSIRTLAKSLSVPRYEVQPDDKVLFLRMSSIQGVALQSLAWNGYLQIDDLRSGLVLRSDKELPVALSGRIAEVNLRDEKIMKALQAILTDYPFKGVGGLKERTGLLEYRYDSV